VGVQEVAWDKGGTVRAGAYIFLWKRNENHKLGTGFLVHHRIISAVKRVEFVSERVSYIVLRGRCCNIIVLNVHAPSKEKSDDSKDSFMRNWSRFFFIIFVSTIRKFCYEMLMPDWEERLLSYRQLGMRVCFMTEMIMVLE